jgi:uncharacterized protein YcnI
MKKLLAFSVIFMFVFTLFAGVASAHVTVQPKETTQGTYEVFTVRVPSENEVVKTTKVEVKFPDTVNITRFEPKSGWSYEVQKDETEKITGVIWTTEGEGLSPTEFIQFNMQGKVADDATEIVWKAYQTYADGSVVEWVGAEGSDSPASVTVVNPGDGTSEHGHGTATQTEAADEAVEKEGSSSLPLYLSIAGLIVALLALGIAFKKRG